LENGSIVTEGYPIIQLMNDKQKFQIQELTLRLQTDYAYVSDPPIFADIGTADVVL